MTLSEEATTRNDTSGKNADVRILLIGERKLHLISYFFSILWNLRIHLWNFVENLHKFLSYRSLISIDLFLDFVDDYND